jgi:hypothetical protein
LEDGLKILVKLASLSILIKLRYNKGYGLLGLGLTASVLETAYYKSDLLKLALVV